MWKTALVVVVAGLLAGCQDSKKANEENFSTAIQSYLDTRDSLCVGVPGRVYPYPGRARFPLDCGRSSSSGCLGQGRFVASGRKGRGTALRAGCQYQTPICVVPAPNSRRASMMHFVRAAWFWTVSTTLPNRPAQAVYRQSGELCLSSGRYGGLDQR